MLTHVEQYSLLFNKIKNYERFSMAQEILNVDQVAEILHLHAMTIYRLVKDGKLPGFKVGGRWRFDRHALDDWMVDREQVARFEAENRKLGIGKKPQEG